MPDLGIARRGWAKPLPLLAGPLQDAIGGQHFQQPAAQLAVSGEDTKTLQRSDIDPLPSVRLPAQGNQGSHDVGSAESLQAFRESAARREVNAVLSQQVICLGAD